MTSTEWLLKKVADPIGSDDFYPFYDEYCETHGHLTNETYKRYARKAMQEYRDTHSYQDGIQTELTENGLQVKLKSFNVTTEEDIRKQAGLAEEEWDCHIFRVKSSQNEQNPWHSVNAEFRRKKELEFPLIQKSEIHIDSYENVDRTPSDLTVNISDIHAPMHDSRVLDIFIQYVKEKYPATIVVNGDALDLSDWSDKFLASLECRNQTQEGINVVSEFLGKLRQVCPESKIILMEGNHSARMKKAILKNVSAAMGLKRADNLDGYEALSIPNLLCLDTLNVEWYDYPEGEFWANENLRFHHGETLNLEKRSNEIIHCEIMGHNHKHLLVSKTKHIYQGKKQVWIASFGCACAVDGTVPAVKSHMDWQQGFGIIYHDDKDSQPVHVYVYDGKALIEGKIYKSRG